MCVTISHLQYTLTLDYTQRCKKLTWSNGKNVTMLLNQENDSPFYEGDDEVVGLLVFGKCVPGLWVVGVVLGVVVLLCCCCCCCFRKNKTDSWRNSNEVGVENLESAGGDSQHNESAGDSERRVSASHVQVNIPPTAPALPQPPPLPQLPRQPTSAATSIIANEVQIEMAQIPGEQDGGEVPAACAPPETITMYTGLPAPPTFSQDELAWDPFEDSNWQLQSQPTALGLVGQGSSALRLSQESFEPHDHFPQICPQTGEAQGGTLELFHMFKPSDVLEGADLTAIKSEDTLMAGHDVLCSVARDTPGAHMGHIRDTSHMLQQAQQQAPPPAPFPSNTEPHVAHDHFPQTIPHIFPQPSQHPSAQPSPQIFPQTFNVSEADEWTVFSDEQNGSSSPFQTAPSPPPPPPSLDPQTAVPPLTSSDTVHVHVHQQVALPLVLPRVRYII
jgi:hypothetical protein